PSSSRLKNSTVTKWTSCAISRAGCTNWGRQAKMILSKMKMLWAAVVASGVIRSVALACFNNGAATADHGNATSYVVGPDGKLIGAAPNPSIRSQWETGGPANEDI